MHIHVFSIILAFASQAEIHRYVDENGKVHFTDRPPADVKSSVVEVKVNVYESPEIVPFVYEPSNENKTTGRRKVVMYSTSWCGYCKKARQYFKANNIKFKEYDIEKSKKAKRDYDKLGGRGVPIILVDKQRMNGFSQPMFESMYND